MIDSHTHLFLCERREDELVAAALRAGVERMLNVGLGADSNEAAIAAAERHEGVFATVGRHPTSAGEFDDALAAEISRAGRAREGAGDRRDGHRLLPRTATREEQRRAFEAQIEIAAEQGLPIVIHARDPDGETGATDDVFEILDARADGGPVILHCFLAPWRVDDAIERGWHCSFSGIVTYPKSDALREAAAKLPDELLLVETDAPYLAPQPVRGRPTSPPTSSRPPRWSPRCAAKATRSSSGRSRRTRAALFGW